MLSLVLLGHVTPTQSSSPSSPSKVNISSWACAGVMRATVHGINRGFLMRRESLRTWDTWELCCVGMTGGGELTEASGRRDLLVLAVAALRAGERIGRGAHLAGSAFALAVASCLRSAA